MNDLLLLPRPRELEHYDGEGAPANATVSETEERELSPEAYRLRIADGQISLAYADAAGRRYAHANLKQLKRSCGEMLPALEILDWPDFPVRGYMLDISRDRVPTRGTLARLVDVLDLLRINHLQLYTEHTFAYTGHETVWGEASPLTGADVEWLDGLCAERGIELVANQNTFGHMARWLRHPAYRDRAEAPEGFDTKFGTHLAAAVLAPTEDNADFALGLCRELLAHHRSRRINIGCDETFELGKGQSAADVEARGKHRVYLDHLLRLIHGLHADGREVLFWGDILRDHPELAAELPKTDVVALAWHYEAPSDPSALPDALFEVLSDFGITRDSLRGFEAHVRSFEQAGVPFWVCPGTSTWNTLIGRLRNARGNLLDAAEIGLSHGAGGYLITDWGDNGHMQPLAVSWPPLAYGAALAWCLEANRNLDVAPALDAFVFEDEAGVLGALLDRIGNLFDATGKTAMNGSALFTDLLSGGALLGSMGETDPERTAQTVIELDEAIAELQNARPAASDGEIVRLELAAALHLARHGAWRIARGAGLPRPSDPELAADLGSAISRQREAWLARSRSGGLADSLARLEKVLAEYARA
ncbi:MAG: glycoside hydrolase [Deltaproteobacteria bacterium]|nr:glycoside hydrolase [Deltaproteobacteria bacterium]